MKHLLVTALCFLSLTASARSDTYVRQPSVDVLRYDITLELSDTFRSLAGDTKIQICMREDHVSGMWLDLAEMRVEHVRVDGIERPFSHKNGRLSFGFGRDYSNKEIAVIEVQYHGRLENSGMTVGKNRYHRKVLFTNNWPDNAHHWFPSIDHPYDKAAADITVTAPSHYEVVSNGRKIAEHLLPNGMKLTRWSERKSIPTYCIAIGLAEFAIAPQKDFDGIPLQWYSFPEDAQAAASKFRRTSSIINFFQSVIGPYPFEKLAQIESTIPFGGMEYASAIFYGEALFKDNPVTEFPVPHEIAHQWFGDSITISDWDHLWLSEGFATYFDALFYEHSQSSNRMKQLMKEYEERLKASRTARTATIIDPHETDLWKKLSPLTYEKGAWVLHMLRGLLGDEIFFKGIRRYYQLYANGNTRSEDFEKVMESVSGISLHTFFHQWLYQPGWPEYRVTWRWDETAREVRIRICQTQARVRFDMPLDLVLCQKDTQPVHRLRIADAIQEFRIPAPAKPLAIEVDPEDRMLKSVVIEARQ